MKIVSLTGQKIKFNLSGHRKLLIEPIIATEVNEQEYFILEGRLGKQIGIQQESTPAPKTPAASKVTAPAQAAMVPDVVPSGDAPSADAPVAKA
jgi:hypothetical protein